MRLYATGVTEAVPETIESSLQLGEALLVETGVPMGLVIASVHERRDGFRKLLGQGLGGVTIMHGGYFNRAQSIFVSAAGPLASLALGGLVWLVDKAYPVSDPYAIRLVSNFLWVNFFWTAINLLPILPLDGGQIIRDVLGPRNVIAVTGVSQTYTADEKRTAQRFARELGVEHVLIETDELDCAAFAANPPDRCYHCKGELFDKILDLARRRGIAAVYDATNTDDLADYRPGRRATEERCIMSPLLAAGFSKKDVRALSRELGARLLGQAQ